MSHKKTTLVAMLAAAFPIIVAAQENIESAMQTVVVTASLHSQSVAQAPAFTTVVTAEDIARSPVNSLGDLLRETVGVNNQTDGTGRDEIQIRGLAGKYTLMLVNGKRVSSAGALWRGGDFDFSSVPLSSIKRVEIVRGPMAALYGSDAIGGVINIITKTPSTDWKSTLSAEYRTVGAGDGGNAYRVGGSTSGAVSERVSLALTGEVYDRDAWYSTSASDPTRPPRLEEKKTANLLGTATIALSDMQSLDIDLAYNHDKRPRALYYYAFYPAYNYEAKDFREQEISRTTYGLTHRATWGWGSTTAMLSYEAATIDDFNSRYDKPQQRRVKEDNTYAKAYASLAAGPNTVTAGIDLRDQRIKDAVYSATGDTSTRTSAVFAEDEIALAKQLSFTVAGRLDHTDTFGNHFSPKTYLVYQASDVVTVKGGVSKAFRAPEAYQLSSQYRVISCGGSCYLAGNPNLAPETSTNIEFGVEAHTTGWNLSAALFRNNVDDMIVSVYDASVPIRRWVNVAKAKTRGLELQGDVNLNSAWSVGANATHLNADYTDERGQQTELDMRPRNIAQLNLNWKATSTVQASLAAHYTGKQQYEGSDLPGYTRTDLALAWRPAKALVLRAGVKNLSNVNLEEKNKNFASFELGRNYYVSASQDF